MALSTYPDNVFNGEIFLGVVDVNNLHADTDNLRDQQSISSPQPSFRDLQSNGILDGAANGEARVTAANVLTPVSYATKQDWETHQALITRLYLDDKNSLAKVMSFMKSQHGFKATIKMYKTHIKNWGLERKNKEAEMRAIVRKQKDRASRGQDSIIRVRNRTLNFTEVLRYWKRKGFSIDDILAQGRTSPTPEAVKLLTPVPSPIMTPRELAVPESILRCIADYFRGSFESGIWVRTPQDVQCYSVKSKAGLSVFDNITNQIILACELFASGIYREAGQTMFAANAGIEESLLVEGPETLSEICRLLTRLRSVNLDGITEIVLRQFSALAQGLLGCQHPLRRICAIFSSAVTADVDSILLKCLENITDQFRKHVGPWHISTLILQYYCIDQRGKDDMTKLQMLRDLVTSCDNSLSPYDERSLGIRTALAANLMCQDYYVEAKEFGQFIINCSQHDEFYCSQGLYIVARCQYFLGEVSLGISSLRTAIELYPSQYDPQESRARTWLLQLERMYMDQGQPQAAAQVRHKRQTMLEWVDFD